MSLSKSLIDFIEFLATSCYGRLISNQEKNVSISEGKTKSQGSQTIQKAFSTVNVGAVEILLTTINEIICTQLKRYVNFFDQYDAPDHKGFIKHRNTELQKQIFINQEIPLADEEDMKEPEELKIEGDDRIKGVLNNLSVKEFNKIHRFYDPLVVTKLMRLLEMAT